jgi:hypothetical protein
MTHNLTSEYVLRLLECYAQQLENRVDPLQVAQQVRNTMEIIATHAR